MEVAGANGECPLDFQHRMKLEHFSGCRARVVARRGSAWGR